MPCKPAKNVPMKMYSILCSVLVYGKSAIMTGIVVSLGGNAHNTGKVPEAVYLLGEKVIAGSDHSA